MEEVTFYFFTRHNKIPPKNLLDWQNAYKNFQFLCLNRNTNTTKRALQDVSNDALREITDVMELPKMKKKGQHLKHNWRLYYFTSSEARLSIDDDYFNGDEFLDVTKIYLRISSLWKYSANASDKKEKQNQTQSVSLLPSLLLHPSHSPPQSLQQYCQCEQLLLYL